MSLVPNLPDSLLPFEGPLFLPDFWAWLTISRNRSRMQLKMIKRFGGSPVIRKISVRHQPGNLVIMTDNRVVPAKATASRQEGPEACYTCAPIDLGTISTITLEFG